MKVKAFNRQIKGYYFIQKFDENGKHEFIMNPENTLEDPGYVFHVQPFKTASEAESYINSATEKAKVLYERYMGLTTEAGADYEHTYRSFFKDAEAEDSIGNIVWNIFASMLVNRGTSKLKFKVGEFL